MSLTTTEHGDAGAEASRAPGPLRFLGEGSSTATPGAVRWAAVAFAALAVVAVVVIFRQGDDQWFFLDEWVFIAGRDLSLDGLLAPHNEHFVFVPALVYGGLFRLVGINAYWPYQAVLVAAHVTSCTLLRVVMRRAGVGPWLATVVAGALLVFGSGRQDIVWAFQISFTGALAFGLAQLLLADHDGPDLRRDLLAVLCGIAAVATSGVGVVMVGAVGLSAALRGRWRAAAVQVVPPAVVWATWWLARGRDAYGESSGPSGAVEYVTQGLRHAFAGLGRNDLAALVLAAFVVAGLVMALRGRALRTVVAEAALPLALLGGGLAFLAITGFGRAGRTGNDVPQATRYVYLAAALVLPVVAYALQQLAGRARWAALVPCAVLVLGVPGNAAALRADGFEALTLGRRDVVLVGANLPELDQLPADHAPFGLFEGPVTVGWLREMAAESRIPDAPDVAPEVEAMIALEVLTRVVPVPALPNRCSRLDIGLRVVLEAGEGIAFEGPLVVQLRRGDAISPPMTVPAASSGAQRLVAVGGPLTLELAPVLEDGTAVPVEVCLPTRPDVNPYGQIDLGYSGDGRRLALLGDSISVLSLDELADALDEWAVLMAVIQGEGLSGGGLSDASGLESMDERAERIAASHPEVVVVALGTNDALLPTLSAEDALDAWDRIAAANEGACLVGVTFPAAGDGVDPDEAAAIDERMREHSDVVVPWAEAAAEDPGRYLSPDGIHPTADGSARFAALVADAVEACPG